MNRRDFLKYSVGGLVITPPVFSSQSVSVINKSVPDSKLELLEFCINTTFEPIDIFGEGPGNFEYINPDTEQNTMAVDVTIEYLNHTNNKQVNIEFTGDNKSWSTPVTCIDKTKYWLELEGEHGNIKIIKKKLLYDIVVTLDNHTLTMRDFQYV